MSENKKDSDKPQAQETVFGMPVNFKGPYSFKNMWNSETNKIWLPKSFGIGWTINFHAVAKKLGLLK